MKNTRPQIRLPLLGLFILIVYWSCGGEKLDTITLSIAEMNCPEYQTVVQQTIMQQTGIKKMSLNWETQSVIVTIRPDQISAKTLINALLDAGFTVNGAEGNPLAYAALPKPCPES